MFSIIVTALIVSAANALITLAAQRAIKEKLIDAGAMADAARMHAIAASRRAGEAINMVANYQATLQPALALLPKARSRKAKAAE